MNHYTVRVQDEVPKGHDHATDYTVIVSDATDSADAVRQAQRTIDPKAKGPYHFTVSKQE